MGLYNDFINQTRKPEGFLGKMMVNGMNSGHAKMADWGISHLSSITPKEIRMWWRKKCGRLAKEIYRSKCYSNRLF